MAYLSKSDWKKHLNLKEHKAVKKTGISDILGDYESAAKKGDNAAQMIQLEKLRDKIPEVKRTWSALKTLTSYLDGMDRDAKTQQDKIRNALDKAADDDDLEGVDSALSASLEKLRKVSENNAHNFALAPGRPSSGLVVSRKSVKREHIKKAMEMRGKAGVYFTGTCFFDSGKFIFVFPEQPPRGMAKAIKSAAMLHAEMGIKVRVRGGGVEFDDDADEELGEAGETASVTQGATSYPDAAKFDPLINQVRQLPRDKWAGALSGIVGKINQLIKQAEGDAALNGTQKQAVIAQLGIAMSRVQSAIKEAANGPTQPGPAVYPTQQAWMDLLDRCLRQPPDKRRIAIDTLQKKVLEVIKQVAADPGLTDQTRPVEQKKLDDVLKAIQTQARDEAESGSTRIGLELVRRFRTLQLEFDKVKVDKVLPGGLQSDIARALDAARTALTQSEVAAAGDAMNRAEAKLKEARAFDPVANARADRGAKQTRIHDSVKQGVEAFRKGAFAAGTADALFRDTGKVTMDKGLKKLGEDFRACEKDPSPQNLSALSRDGQTYLAGLAKAKGKLKPEKDGDKIKAIEAQEELARQAVQRVRLLELANEMHAMGTPPWDDAKEERMAELQAAFFFEEGAIKKGVADFGAPAWKDGGADGGVNDAWAIKRVDPKWGNLTTEELKKIERGEVTINGPDDLDRLEKIRNETRTYIFKAQHLEATNFVGIPKNGGVAREVLAAKMSEEMNAYGFDVGVCPTHFVEIDSAKLGGMPQEEDRPRALGAMQELGRKDADLVDLLREKGAQAKADIDHKNISDIVAFDLMFLSLDRHAKNAIVKKGQNGEKDKLVPIDHGIGLPDPDGLGFARFRLFGAQNAMNQPDLRNNEPLAPETRENLKRMDAKALVGGVKRRQADAEARHPETKGKVDPAEFDRMEKRILFMQAAADIMTASEMTQAIACHFREINAAAPDGMAALATALKKRIDATRKGLDEYRSFQSKTDAANAHDRLTDLGWCAGFGVEGINTWLTENADFAIKVLKGNIQNPKARDEVRELAEQLNDPAINQQLPALTLGARLDLLRKESERRRRPAPIQQDNALKQDGDRAQKLFEQLGGQDELNALLAVCPDTPTNTNPETILAMQQWAEVKKLGGADAIRAMSAVFMEDRATDIQTNLVNLPLWKEFNDLGGVKDYIACGGWMAPLATALQIFRSLKPIAGQGGIVERIRQIDDAQVDQEQKKILERLKTEAQQKFAMLQDPDHIQEIKVFLDQARDYEQNGDATRAQGRLMAMLELWKVKHKTEADQRQLRQRKVDAVKKQMVDAAKAKPDFDPGPYNQRMTRIEDELVRYQLKAVDGGLAKMELDIDHELNGPNSRQSKLNARVQVVDNGVNRLNGQPGADKAQTLWQAAKQSLAAYNMARFNADIDTVELYLGAVGRMARVEQIVGAFQGDQAVKKKLDDLVVSLRKDLTDFTPAGFKYKINSAVGNHKQVLPDDLKM